MMYCSAVPLRLHQDQRPVESGSGRVQHMQGSELSLRYGLVAEVTLVPTGIFT